ncbi:MAG: 4Fe-4S dicluster domain-containing protein [Desulfobacterales bacterium]
MSRKNKKKETENILKPIKKAAGYILVDPKKCQGCLSCMLACSLAHEGLESLSLSRIQVTQNSFEKWPDDLMIYQCRQCVEAPCVHACPYSALRADPENGYVRMVDREKCIGCGKCVRACPYQPGGPIASADRAYEGQKKSRKCDLCADTPFWEETGGVGGKQICIEVCTLNAISYTTDTPEQSDDGYRVNLRDEDWGKLGFPTD